MFYFPFHENVSVFFFPQKPWTDKQKEEMGRNGKRGRNGNQDHCNLFLKTDFFNMINQKADLEQM